MRGVVWGGGAAPSPVKIFFLYNGSVVRVSASYSSDLTVILGTGHWSEGALVRRVTGPKVI